MIEQPCPLCGNAAAYRLSDANNRKRFHCDHCGDFVITVSAEKRLSGAPQQWRDQLRSMVAATPSDHILDIRKAPAHNSPPGLAHPALHTEYPGNVFSRHGRSRTGWASINLTGIPTGQIGINEIGDDAQRFRNLWRKVSVFNHIILDGDYDPAPDKFFCHV